jgi:pyrimidine operon attenuation protein/uracil phosphoribosyltransferase
MTSTSQRHANKEHHTKKMKVVGMKTRGINPASQFATVLAKCELTVPLCSSEILMHRLHVQVLSQEVLSQEKGAWVAKSGRVAASPDVDS